MSSAWQVSTIESLCSQVTSGGTPSRKVPEYFVTPHDGGIPWLKTKELDDRIIEETEEHITKEAMSASSAKMLPKGTVAMAMYGATVGKLAILGKAMTCNQAVCAMVVDEKKAEHRFLFYSLLHNREAIINLAVGSAQQNLSGQVIKNVRLPFPNLAEQRRIAGVLGALDDLIEMNRTLSGDLQDLALTRYAQLAADVGAMRRLGDLAVVNARQTKPIDGGTLTYLDIASVNDRSIDWPTAIPWRDAPSRARRLAMSGSTIWSTVRPNRRAHAFIGQAPDDLVVSTGFVVLEPGRIGAAELFCATDGDDFVEYLMSRAEGSAYPAVRGSVFEDALVLYLGADKSREFEGFARPLLDAATALDVENRELAATRDEILPLLMSGKVRVSEVVA